MGPMAPLRSGRAISGVCRGGDQARCCSDLVNAIAIGTVWGLLRWVSSSVIVSSVRHGLWNGMVYVLFGFGTKVGPLGIKNPGLFGPEVGVLGLALNLVFAALVWHQWKSRAGTASK